MELAKADSSTSGLSSVQWGYPRYPSVPNLAAASISNIGTASREDVLYIWSRLGEGGEQVIGVWGPDLTTVHHLSFSAVKTLAVVPCFWPHLLLLGPCMYARARDTEMRLQNTLYFATNEGCGTAVQRHAPAGPSWSCCGFTCCRPRDAGATEDWTFATWNQVLSVSTNHRAWLCWQTPSVQITEQGFRVTGSGDGQQVHQNMQQWYVADPDGVAATMKKCVRAYRGNGNLRARLGLCDSSEFPIVPMTEAGSNHIPIFTAFEDALSDRRVVVIDTTGTIEDVLSAVEVTFASKLPVDAAVGIVHAHGGGATRIHTPQNLTKGDFVVVLMPSGS